MPAELKGKLVAEIPPLLACGARFQEVQARLIREFTDFVESVETPGSAWNSAGERWRSYVNIRVWFPVVPSLGRMLPMRSVGSRLWPRTCLLTST